MAGAPPEPFEVVPPVGAVGPDWARVVTRRDPDLVAIAKGCREIELAPGALRVHPRAISSGRGDEVADPCILRQSEDAGVVDGTDDLDHEERSGAGGAWRDRPRRDACRVAGQWRSTVDDDRTRRARASGQHEGTDRKRDRGESDDQGRPPSGPPRRRVGTRRGRSTRSRPDRILEDAPRRGVRIHASTSPAGWSGDRHRE